MGRFNRLAEDMGDIEGLAWKEAWLYADACSDIIRNMPHHQRKRVAAAVIIDMLEQQGGICPLCDSSIDRSVLGSFHVDHIIPFFCGGGYEHTNLQVAHPLCNLKKGNTVTLQDLVPYLERKAEQLDS